MEKQILIFFFIFSMFTWFLYFVALIFSTIHCMKSGNFSGPYFPVFGLNAEIYGVNLRIQSKYKKIRTRKNSIFGHFHVVIVLITRLIPLQTLILWFCFITSEPLYGLNTIINWTSSWKVSILTVFCKCFSLCLA